MSAQSNPKAVELDDLKQQYAALQADVKEIAEMISMGVTERATEAKEQAVDHATALGETAIDKASQLQSDAERAITNNPLAAIAICAGIGFLLGVASRK